MNIRTNNLQTCLIRNGFALNDLLVVVVLLGIGTSLLLPAIQSAREAARQGVCEQRLADIGADAIIYDAMFCRLPAELGSLGGIDWGSWTSSSSPDYLGFGQYTSPMALAASATENFRIEPRFFEPDKRFAREPYFFDRPGWAAVAGQERDRYLCPSAANPEPEFYFLAVQSVNLGDPTQDAVVSFYDSNPESEYGMTNYVGCLGATSAGFYHAYSRVWQWRGMITCRELVSMEHVSLADGTANTIMFGENIGTIKVENRQTIRSFAQCWFTGGVARGRGSAPLFHQGTPINPLLGRATRSSAFGFGSMHRSGVNFVYGDGSVHQLSRSIDWQTYYDLCGAFDTE